MAAFVETTIAVDALLGPKSEQDGARAALARHATTTLPVYAIKEIKAGPLRNYVWFHNKLAAFSLPDAMRALQMSALSPKKYTTATAIEAMSAAMQKAFTDKPTWSEKYSGRAINREEMFKDHVRLSLKRIIFKAWKGRRRLTTQVSDELDCYSEAPITETSHGIIEISPTACDVSSGCHLARMMSGDPASVKAMCEAVESAPPKRENERRLAALRKLKGDGWRQFQDKHCRHLGDAAFAFLAPMGTPILTKNERDLGPLAKSLAKVVETL